MSLPSSLQVSLFLSEQLPSSFYDVLPSYCLLPSVFFLLSSPGQLPSLDYLTPGQRSRAMLDICMVYTRSPY